MGGRSLGSARVIARSEDGEETREVRFRVRDGLDGAPDKGLGVVIEEESNGPLTLDVYDVSPHVRRVILTRDATEMLARVLGVGQVSLAAERPLGENARDCDVSAPRLVERGVGEFFDAGDVYLSDLMDLMDLVGIPYSFESITSAGTLAFRPAG